MTTQSSFIRKVITTGSFVLAAALVTPASMHFDGFSSNAFAEESHEGSAGHTGAKGGSGKGKGTSGKGGSESGSGKGKDSITKGQGGPDASSDGKGPNRGKPTSTGDKKVWASEGIDSSVEMGRLNIMRAPQHVRDQALAEALKTTNWDLYKLTSLQAVVNKIVIYKSDLTVVRIDSPSEALALYQALLRDGKVDLKETRVGEDGKIIGTTTVVDGKEVFTPTLFTVEGGNTFIQAAIFLASASDKTKPIYDVTVKNVNIVLGVTNPINPATGKAYTDVEMAIAAEWVRQAIQIGHDAVTPDTTLMVAPSEPTNVTWPVVVP